MPVIGGYDSHSCTLIVWYNNNITEDDCICLKHSTIAACYTIMIIRSKFALGTEALASSQLLLPFHRNVIFINGR